MAALLARGGRLLLLAGVAEAADIARGVLGATRCDIIALVDAASWEAGAGRLGLWRAPPPRLALRGPFAGAEGALAACKWDRIAGVIDAAHPFDAETAAATAHAARALGLPLWRYRRPSWAPPAGWRAGDAAEAAAAPPFFARTFLGVERGGWLFASERRDLWTLTRLHRPVRGRYPLPRGDFALGAPPFTAAHEAQILEDYRINFVVLENVGGGSNAGLFAAAAARGLPGFLLNPPAPPPLPALGGGFSDAADLVRAAASRMG